MYRASTPKHYFKIPSDMDTVNNVWLSYAQNGKKVLRRDLSTMQNYEGDIWFVQLTQEETNLFDTGIADAQIRILFKDGTSFPSKTFKVRVNYVIDDEVMI